MVNIYKNKTNKVTTDVTSFFTAVWLCNHISSNEWYIFLLDIMMKVIVDIMFLL